MDTDTQVTANESPATYYAGLAAQSKQDAIAHDIQSMWLAHDSMHRTVREYRQELRVLDPSLGEALYCMKVLLGRAGKDGEWSEFLKEKGIPTRSAERLANAYERSLEPAPVTPVMLFDPADLVVAQPAAVQTGAVEDIGKDPFVP